MSERFRSIAALKGKYPKVNVHYASWLAGNPDDLRIVGKPAQQLIRKTLINANTHHDRSGILCEIWRTRPRSNRRLYPYYRSLFRSDHCNCPRAIFWSVIVGESDRVALGSGYR